MARNGPPERPHAWQRDVERFESQAVHYERSPLQALLGDPMHRAVVRRATAAVGSPGTVLDVGCGTGRLLRRLGRGFPTARCLGVDPAGAMVAVARARWPAGLAPATFVQAAVEALPLPEAAVDLAVSTLSSHHWADPAAGLAEIARVLRPGGALVLADLFPTGWRRAVPTLLRIHHLGLSTPPEAARMLAAAGFDRLDWHPVPRRLHLLDIVVARRPGGPGGRG